MRLTKILVLSAFIASTAFAADELELLNAKLDAVKAIKAKASSDFELAQLRQILAQETFRKAEAEEAALTKQLEAQKVKK